MIRSRIKTQNMEFILISIYITSKMLWDKIPYIFEWLFWLMILWNAGNYICPLLQKRRINRYLIHIEMFIVYVLINGIMQDSTIVLIRSIYELIIYMMVMLYFLQVRKKINLLYCLKEIVIWGAIISVLTWFEYITKHYILTDLSGYGQILFVGNNGFRATVFSRSFLSHGIVLGIFTMIGLYIWYVSRKKRYLILGMFAYSAILATGSRGPLVAFFVAIVFFYYYDVFLIRKKRIKKYRFIAVGIVLGLLIITILNLNVDPTTSSMSYFIYRIQNIFNWTGDAGNVGRILIWKKSLNNWFVKSPIFGIGPSKTGSWGDASLGVTESGILKRLCELGMVGTLMFYSLIFYIIRKSTKIKNKGNKKEMALWLSIFLGIFINDITVQSTEEIMVAFWLWCSLGGILYLKQQDKLELREINR